MGRHDKIDSEDPPDRPPVRMPGGPPAAEPGESDVLAQRSQSHGLINIYIVDADDTGRRALHGKLSGRNDVLLRSYKGIEDFFQHIGELEGGCVLYATPSYDRTIQAALASLRADRRFVTVVLSRDASLHSAVNAMKRGAADYLLRPCKPDELWASIEESMERVRTQGKLSASAKTAQERIARLTARERDVLHGLVDGKSNKEIAIALNISPRTIEIYRAHMMEKLGVRSLSEALRYAFWAGPEF